MDEKKIYDSAGRLVYDGDSGGGITDAAKGYILALFENAAYKNDTMQATYNALRKEWGMGSGTPQPARRKSITT
uniref:Uncharacterized protein n=1 Tax=Myoviridae sp. ctSGr1 TaxID=2827609 RepID=A0A8S5LRQ2_9CAUD|nr:MAG TPA: hypothetical protein [Myoviridae sp. ctSGr1]